MERFEPTVFCSIGLHDDNYVHRAARTSIQYVLKLLWQCGLVVKSTTEESVWSNPFFINNKNYRS
jgi:hypothetical protein